VCYIGWCFFVFLVRVFCSVFERARKIMFDIFKKLDEDQNNGKLNSGRAIREYR
jgi:hypothetical protein